MARQRTRVRISRSGRVVVVATLAAATTTALFEANIGRSLLLPSAMVAGTPPVLYVLLAFGLLRGAPVGRRLGWAVAACGVYAALGLLSGLTLSLAHPMSLEGALRRSLWSFAPAPLVHLLAAPLMLIAWRSRLTAMPLVVRWSSSASATPARSPATSPPASPDWDSILHVSPPAPWVPGPNSTAAERTGREREATPEAAAPRERLAAPRPRTPAPAVPAVTDAAAPLVATPATQSLPAAAPSRAIAPPGSTTPARPASKAPAPEVPASAPIVAPVPPAKPAAPAPAPTAPRRRVMPPAAEQPVMGGEPEAVIRIPFDRIADQLPPDVFTLPPARLADSMQEPHVLLVPRRHVLPQLGEGAVEVAWALVEGQFPELAFAMPQAEVRRRFPEWVLSLPMDVVVSQIPFDLFRVQAPAADLSGIGDFPAPFTPGPPEPENPASSASQPIGGPAPSGAAPTLPVASAPPASAPTEIRQEPIPDRAPKAAIASPIVKSAAPPVATLASPPPVVRSPRITPPPATATRESTPPADALTTVSAPAAPVPSGGAASINRTVEMSRAAPGASVPVTDRETETLAQALAPGLAPLGTFDWQTRRSSGRALVCFVPPALTREPIDALADRAAGLVARLTSWGIDQMTIRTARLACVLTPLGARGCLAAAVRRGGSVAMLELLSARAARATADVGSAASPSNAVTAVDTVAAVGATHHSVADAARALAAFGPVAAAVVAANGPAPGVYVFAGREQGVLAGVARAVYDAVVAVHDQAALGALESVVLRRGRERVVVRPLRREAGEPAILATAGEVAMAGRAHRAAAQAAAALEAC
jgi:hypothetical protein